MDSQFKNAKPFFIVSNVWNEVFSQLVDISMPSSYLFDNKLPFMGILTYTKEILSSWNDSGISLKEDLLEAKLILYHLIL